MSWHLRLPNLYIIFLLQESLAKTYEREDSPKPMPLTAPAALSDVALSWPSANIKNCANNNALGECMSAISLPKEPNNISPIPPLPISSRDSSIETAVTTPYSQILEDNEEYDSKTAWNKNVSKTNQNDTSQNSKLIQKPIQQKDNNEASSMTDNFKRPATQDILVTINKSPSAIKSIESKDKENASESLDHSDEYIFNLSTGSDGSPSSDTNLITVSPTKVLAVESAQPDNECTKDEIRDEVILDRNDSKNIASAENQVAETQKTDNTYRVTNDVTPKRHPQVTTEIVDSICEKLMIDLVKDTYSSMSPKIIPVALATEAQPSLENDPIDLESFHSNKPTKKQENEHEKLPKDRLAGEVPVKPQTIKTEYEQNDHQNANSESLISSNPLLNASSRSRSRPQDLMLTTFDLSSESSSEDSSKTSSKKIKENTVQKDGYKDRDEYGGNKVPDFNSTDFEAGGNYIDDDFGISLQQESEHIRQQQLLIEQEISRIQQETGVVSLREIPDKPPPPYTPPSSPSSKVLRRRLKDAGMPKYVPSSKEDLCTMCDHMSQNIFDVHESLQTSVQEKDTFLKKLMEMTLPEEILEDKGKYSVQCTGTGDNASIDSISSSSHAMFVNFVFDLVKEISASIYSCETEKQSHIWMAQKPLMKDRLALPKDASSLSSIITREVMVAFGYEKRAAKENLIVRWSPQKRRDRVDQILVRELHSEEKEWTDYAQDETLVKDSVTDSLFELLLADTVARLKQPIVN